jgi:hypothetical protein
MMTDFPRRSEETCALRFETQEIGKRQSADGQPADPQKAAPRNAVAELVVTVIEERQHERAENNVAARLRQDKACRPGAMAVQLDIAAIVGQPSRLSSRASRPRTFKRANACSHFHRIFQTCSGAALD